MEAAAIIRNSIESWRGSPVRWLLDRVSEHLPRLPEPGDALLARSNRWQEEFWSSHRATSAVLPRRRQVVWTEQGELFRDESPSEAKTQPVIVERQGVKAFPKKRSHAPTLTRSTVRAPVSHSYADQPKTVRTADIARYLQVNSAVDGIKGVSWFQMPKRHTESAYSRSLWKGRPVGTPFVTGC